MLLTYLLFFLFIPALFLSLIILSPFRFSFQFLPLPTNSLRDLRRSSPATGDYYEPDFAYEHQRPLHGIPTPVGKTLGFVLAHFG